MCSPMSGEMQVPRGGRHTTRGYGALRWLYDMIPNVFQENVTTLQPRCVKSGDGRNKHRCVNSDDNHNWREDQRRAVGGMRCHWWSVVAGRGKEGDAGVEVNERWARGGEFFPEN